MQNGFDFVVFLFALAYFIITIGIGIYSRKLAAKGEIDYYLAGRGVGAFVNGTALTSTYFSPASFLGLPAFVFLLGYPMWWALIGIIAGMCIAGPLTAAPLRKYGPVTFTDFYCDRYEMPVLGRFIAGIPTLIAGILYIVLSIVGTAIFFVALLKLDYKTSVWISVIVVLIYTVLGGMYATTWNASVQTIIMTFAGVAAAIALVSKMGGPESYFKEILINTPKIFNVPSSPDGPPSAIMSSWIAVAGFFLTWHYGFSTMPYTIVRFFTALDEREAKKSIVWATLFAALLYSSLMIVGIGTKAIIEKYHPLVPQAVPIAQKLNKPVAIGVLALIKKKYGIGEVVDYAMIAACEAVGSSVLLGIIVAGGLSIAMSTVAGWVMVVNALIARDWMTKALKTKIAQEKPVLVARIITSIVLILCGLISMNPPALVLDLSGWAFVLIIASLGPSMVLGIWWKRATKAATIVTALLMAPATLYSWLYAKLKLGSPHKFFLNENIITPHQFYWIFVGLIIFIIVSLITQPPKEETIKKYCEDLHN
ncbi:MAG: sodium:solute symporter family protein [Thermosulfidibacteraceae bacterium]|jgi:SSS family solute:Na+ symporter